MSSQTYEMRITKGKTYSRDLLCVEGDLVYREVTAVVSTAPAQITCVAHGVPANWACRIQSATAPIELNTEEGSWIVPKVIDPDTLEINALDLSLAAAFSGSAQLVYRQPADIAGWVFRAQIRDKINGTVLLSFSSTSTDTPDCLISVDVANSCITLEIPATITESLEWTKAVYDLEALKPDGSVNSLIAPSRVAVEAEVTVWN